MAISTISVYNSTSLPITMTYNSVPQTIAAGGGPAAITYTSGDILIDDGKTTYTLLGSGIATIPHSYVHVGISDSIVIASPLSNSTVSSKPLSSYSTATWSILVSFSDKTVLTNFAGTWIVDTYSTYFNSGVADTITSAVKRHWWILILVLLVLVVAIVGGVYYYRKKKRGGM